MDFIINGPKKLIKKLFSGLIPYKTGKGIDMLGTGILKTLKDGTAKFKFPTPPAYPGIPEAASFFDSS